MTKLIGIDNLKGDLLIGITFGISLIVSNMLGIFSLALPPIASFSTNASRLLVLIFLAPVLEEIFFRGVLSNLLRNIFKGDWIPNLLQATAFGLFHLLAYSGMTLEAFELSPILAVGGSFISAILFGISAYIVARRYNNLIVSIIGHAIINGFLVKGLLVLIG